MKFIRNNQLLNRLLICDGLGRAGKSLLVHVLTGFERVEKIEYYICLEFISLGNYYKKISDDMASSILKTQIDTRVFDQMNGRNINTRPDDYSSLSNYHSPQKYIDRQNLEKFTKVQFQGNPNVSSILDKVKKEDPVFLTFSHDLIFKSKIVFDTFKDKVQLVYLNRLPIDIIYEWYSRVGDRIGNDPTETDYLISHNGDALPEYAAGWEEEYVSINQMERVVKLIFICFERNYKGLLNYKNDKRILVINFESLVTESDKEVDKISEFLKLKKLDAITDILKVNNCPRILDDKEYIRREEFIKKNISPKYIDLIKKVNNIYNNIKNLS